MNRIEVLKWDKISLVVPERDDAILWYQWKNNLSLQPYINQRGKIFHLESAYEFYEKEVRKDIDMRFFTVLVRDSQKNLWYISLSEISYENRNANFGIVFFDTSEHGKWYGTEATQLILKYGFEILWLHKIKLDVLAENIGAIRVYQKCWFTESGRKKEEIFNWESYSDLLQMEIMRDNYTITQ